MGCGSVDVEVGQATPTATPLPTIEVSLLIHVSEDDTRWFRDFEVLKGTNAYELTEQVTEGNLESTYYASFFAHFVESIVGVPNQGDKLLAHIPVERLLQSSGSPCP